jgi:hypothetical protein
MEPCGRFSDGEEFPCSHACKLATSLMPRLSLTSFGIDEITQNNVVAVGRGGGRRGKGVGAQSSTPAVTVGAAADAGSEGGEGAEWQTVTRGKAKVGGTKRMTMRVRPSVVEKSGGSQQVAPSFEAASTATRKKKAEDSVNDKLTTMAATIERLMAAQKEMAGSQKTFLKSSKAILNRNKELMETIKTQGETIKTQGEEIKALRALIQDNTRQQTYSEVTAKSGTSVGLQSSQTRSTSAASSQIRNEKSQVQDDRAVSIDMGRFKGSKNNYNVIRDGLRAGLKVNKVTEKLTIKCLRPDPGDRIEWCSPTRTRPTRRSSTLAG